MSKRPRSPGSASSGTRFATGPSSRRSRGWGEDVVLRGRLRDALARLNPGLPAEALDDAFRKLLALDAPTLLERNRAAHRLLVGGINVEYRRPGGSIAGGQARILDFDDPAGNDCSSSTGCRSR